MLTVMLTVVVFAVELLGLLRWRDEPDNVLHCVDKLLNLDGLEIMKVCYLVLQLFVDLVAAVTKASNAFLPHVGPGTCRIGLARSQKSLETRLYIRYLCYNLVIV